MISTLLRKGEERRKTSIYFIGRIFDKQSFNKDIEKKGSMHRRRINTEEEGKVVAAVWEDRTEWIQFLATPAILHQDDLKKKVNSSYASNCPGVIRPVLPIVLVQNSSRSKELN